MSVRIVPLTVLASKSSLGFGPRLFVIVWDSDQGFSNSLDSAQGFSNSLDSAQVFSNSWIRPKAFLVILDDHFGWSFWTVNLDGHFGWSFSAVIFVSHFWSLKIVF